MGSPEQVSIAGGGIGGLSAGIALRRAGVPRVAIYERAPELGHVGAGITVQSNALQALGQAAPDVAAAIVAAGRSVREAAIATDGGRVLDTLPIGELEGRFGYPAVTLHRATLQRLLRDAFDGALHLGRAARGARGDGEQAVLELAGGEGVEGDVVVGADGLRSALRTALHGEAEPRYAGYTCWRGVTSEDVGWPRDRVVEHWGRGARLGVVPIDEGRIYWFATRNAPAGGRDEDVHAVLEAAFGGWVAPIPDLLRGTPADAILRDDLYDRPPLRGDWGRGRVTLLGDAAHPMTPNMGQGACQAIEDAVVLAARLGGSDDPAGALRAYEAERRDRTRFFVERSWTFGRIGQWELAPARWLRDLGVRLTPRRSTERALARVQTFPHDCAGAFEGAEPTAPGPEPSA